MAPVADPLSRRHLLATMPAAVMGAAITPLSAAAESVGQDMLARANRFRALLSPPKRMRASFPLGGRVWEEWNYMTGSAVSPGLPLEAMTPAERDACLDLVATGLSPAGMAKAERVMLLQDVLRDELGKGSADRNRLRFSLALFGEPTDDAPWGWRFEGHHLTLTYTLVGTQVISLTPSSFSAEPNTVSSGPHRGMVTLQEEENLGRMLFAGLSAGHQRTALLQDRAFGNVLATAGREDRIPGQPQGLAVGDMATGAADLVNRLIEIYAIDHLPGALAADAAARIAQSDPMTVHFGWAGDPARGAIYYRLQGATFLLEFATLRNQPQHHHTIRHDFERNLGHHVL